MALILSPLVGFVLRPARGLPVNASILEVGAAMDAIRCSGQERLVAVGESVGRGTRRFSPYATAFTTNTEGNRRPR